MALYYLSNPYNGTDEQEEQRAHLAAKACVTLLKSGISLVSPVVHTHALGAHLSLSKDERRALLMPVDIELLHRCDGMIVLKLEGWQDSIGMRAEINFCQAKGIPVYYTTVEEVLASQFSLQL